MKYYYHCYIRGLEQSLVEAKTFQKYKVQETRLKDKRPFTMYCMELESHARGVYPTMIPQERESDTRIITNE